ncbi:hypothetical protein DL768_009367 [Monosporascus sp. mg162]|nr:hypothetical protein DL768_009367 [Monosporascus sp. mg162]
MNYQFMPYSGPSEDPPKKPPKKPSSGPGKGPRKGPMSCDRCYKDHRTCRGGRPCDRCKDFGWECVTVRHFLKQGPVRGASTAAERILGALMRAEPSFEQYIIGLLSDRRLPGSEHTLLHTLRNNNAAEQRAFRNAFTESQLYGQVCPPRQIANTPSAHQAASSGAVHSAPGPGTHVYYPQTATPAEDIPNTQECDTFNAMYSPLPQGEYLHTMAPAFYDAPIAQQYGNSGMHDYGLTYPVVGEDLQSTAFSALSPASHYQPAPQTSNGASTNAAEWEDAHVNWEYQ